MDGDRSLEIKRWLLLGRKAMTDLDSVLKSRDNIAKKSPSHTSYGVSSSHVWMWESDHKESWAFHMKAFHLSSTIKKNWCFRTVVLEKILESPLDCKEIKPVNPKGNQPWIFIGRTDAEGSILWPPDVKSQLIRKDPDVGKDWRQKKGQQRMRGLNGIIDSKDMNLINSGR